ncbi:MAG: hypothetical protein K2W95_29730 [Candidatus Obscuribacterales bacterium]|nr:hypothetical protein [Candidatus Obscuribacterales bacterium]
MKNSIFATTSWLILVILLAVPTVFSTLALELVEWIAKFKPLFPMTLGESHSLAMLSRERAVL